MYKFVLTNRFRKRLKRLVKKDRGLKENLKNSLEEFKKEHAVKLGKKLYKVRIEGAGKGKSGGYRLIVYFCEPENLLVPVFIYSKSERGSMKLKEICLEMEKVLVDLDSNFVL